MILNKHFQKVQHLVPKIGVVFPEMPAQRYVDVGGFDPLIGPSLRLA